MFLDFYLPYLMFLANFRPLRFILTPNRVGPEPVLEWTPHRDRTAPRPPKRSPGK